MQRLARSLINAAFLFALTIWGGMVAFFTFVVAPLVFADLDRDTAAHLLGDLFPRYFQIQTVCIVVALVALVVRLFWESAPRRLPAIAAGLLTIALAISLYASVLLLPRLVAAQARVPSFVTTPRDDPARVAYGQLHGQAMLLNAAAALLGGAALALVAFEPRLLLRSHGVALAEPSVDESRLPANAGESLSV